MQKIECATLPDSFCELDEVFSINSTITCEAAIAFVLLSIFSVLTQNIKAEKVGDFDLWKTGSSGENWCEKEKTSQQEGQEHPFIEDGHSNQK